jgi:dTDP-4-amino-4,6-dideoxygalactose transaminase
MKTVPRLIPVYPTLAALALTSPTRWRRWFPFSAPGGTWTFSGRVALYYGLRALNLPAKSTILVPNYHQGVEIDTLLAAGYQLRYYRVDSRLDIDLRDAEQQIDRSVVALYVIHYFGFPQPLNAVREFCHAHRLKLIEDCALSLFSCHGGSDLGTTGDLAFYSVYKTLPLPHGGFLVTKREPPIVSLDSVPLRSTFGQTLDLAQKTLRATGLGVVDGCLTRISHLLARLLRWDRAETMTSGGAGWDSRLLRHAASPFAAALMRFIDRDRVVTRRRSNFVRLVARLRGRIPCPFVELPPGVCPLFLPVLVPDKIGFQRDLAAVGVESVNLWDTSHPSCPPKQAAGVSQWRKHCLELPIHQELSDVEIDRIADAVLTVWERQPSILRNAQWML